MLRGLLRNPHLHPVESAFGIVPVVPAAKGLSAHLQIDHIMLFEWDNAVETVFQVLFRIVSEWVGHESYGNQTPVEFFDVRCKSRPVPATKYRVAPHNVPVQGMRRRAFEKPTSRLRQFPWRPEFLEGGGVARMEITIHLGRKRTANHTHGSRSSSVESWRRGHQRRALPPKLGRLKRSVTHWAA